MGRGVGFGLKTLQLFLRVIEFCCAAVIVALFGYFLAKLSYNNLGISNYYKAIEGISGAAVIYTAFAILLVCCVGGLSFFAFLAILLDLAFVGCFIFVAVETRGGANSCSGNVNTPIGSGDVNSATTGSLPSLGTACRMNTACFAVAIVAAVFFLISAIVEFALWRNRKSEKKYGPGPNNNYSEGRGNRKFYQRREKVIEDPALTTTPIAVEKRHPDSLPLHATPAAARTSYQTDATAVGPEPVVLNKYGHIGNGGVGDGYAAPAHHHIGTGYNETARVPNETYTTYQTTGATEMPASRY